MQMKIENKTKWDTKDLRKVFKLALNADNKIEGRFNKHLTVIVKYRNIRQIVKNQIRLGYWTPNETYYYKGCAYYNIGWMRISLPKENINPKIVAQVFIHELEHCRGFRHNQMGKWFKLDVSFLSNYIQINKED